MPLSRYTIANEYCLGCGDLCRTAGRNEPEAILEGVTVAGLIGILRQLGDLVEFAAEVFNSLHDEVMAASARGHELTLRVQQLEVDLPLIEKDFFQKEVYLNVACNKGVVWHANVKVNHGLLTRGDTPHFIMESIEQCRGPPKLFMLDKYDTDGEGACLKRYTKPPFFGMDSDFSSILQEGIQRETRPLKVMNCEISKPPNSDDTISEFKTDVCGETSGGILSMNRTLKFQRLIRPLFRSLGPQMQNLHEEALSERKDPTIENSDVKISFTDSPDSNIKGRDAATDASTDTENANGYQHYMVPKDRLGVIISTLQEKPATCELERTSSFEEWLTLDAHASKTDITVEASCDSSNGFSSHVPSNGSLDSTMKAKENSNNAAISVKTMASKKSKNSASVELIASRVSNLSRKLFKKHGALSNSFMSMAKKIHAQNYYGIQDTDSCDFEPDCQDYDVKCLEMSRPLDEIKEERSAMDKAPSDLAQCSNDSRKHKPEHAVAPTTSCQDSLATRDGIRDTDNVRAMYAVSPSSLEEVCTIASDGCSTPDMLNDENTAYIEEQVVSNGIIISSLSLSMQSDNLSDISPPSHINAVASDSIANCNPETKHISSAQTIPSNSGPPTSVIELVFSSEANVADDNQCYLPSKLQSTRHPSHDDTVVSCYESVDEKLHELHQPMMHQELYSPSIPCLCSNSSSTGTCKDCTFAPDSKDLPLTSMPKSTGKLNGAMQNPTNVLSINGCSEDTKDVGLPLPPIPPLHWLAFKLHAGSAVSSTKLGRQQRPKPLVGHHATDSNSSAIASTKEAEMVQAGSRHNILTSQKEMAHTSVCTKNDHFGIFHGEEILKDSFLDKEYKEIHHHKASRESVLQSSKDEKLKTLKLAELSVHPMEVCSELAAVNPKEQIYLQKEGRHQLSNGAYNCNGMQIPDLLAEKLSDEHENSDQKEKELSDASSNIEPTSEANKLGNGVLGQDDVQNSNFSAHQKMEECGSSEYKERGFSSEVEELARIPPHPIPGPRRYSLRKVTCHNRSMVRKTQSSIQPSSKLSYERNALLEQIKNKSFNLTPVLSRRPSLMSGPRKNFKVVTILERANAIRQVVIEDDDDDNGEDSWGE